MKIPKNQQPDDESIAMLNAVLDEHRETVMAIPDVNGCGIGFSELGDSEKVVIRITVGSQNAVEKVHRKVAEVFGDYPVETVYQPTPYAGKN